MIIHDNKLEIGYFVKEEFPFEKLRFYSEDIITNDDLAKIIMEILTRYKNIDPSIFDRQTMQVKMDARKTLAFFVQEEILLPEEYEEVERTKLKNGIGTQIILDIQKSVSGTEFCIEVLKKLQKKYPRSVFINNANVFVNGEDIQNLRMNKKEMYNPSTRSITELTEEEEKKFDEEMTDEECKELLKKIEKTLTRPFEK